MRNLKHTCKMLLVKYQHWQFLSSCIHLLFFTPPLITDQQREKTVFFFLTNQPNGYFSKDLCLFSFKNSTLCLLFKTFCIQEMPLLPRWVHLSFFLHFSFLVSYTPSQSDACSNVSTQVETDPKRTCKGCWPQSWKLFCWHFRAVKCLPAPIIFNWMRRELSSSFSHRRLQGKPQNFKEQ